MDSYNWIGGLADTANKWDAVISYLRPLPATADGSDGLSSRQRTAPSPGCDHEYTIDTGADARCGASAGAWKAAEASERARAMALSGL